MDKRSDWTCKLAWSAGLALILCIGLEVGARLYVVQWASDEAFVRYASLAQLGARSHQSNRSTPHRYLGYAPTANYALGSNRHNSLGFRGEEFPRAKPPGEFRIVCEGGSTTYTSSVEDHRQSYPAQLEAELRRRGKPNVRVINAGCDGWTSWESLINFELRVLDLEPDLEILYHGVNDVHPRLVWPREAYRGDNSGYLRPVDPMFLPSVLEYSTFARSLLVKLGRLEPHASLHRTLAGYAETYRGDAFYRQREMGVYPQKIFAEVRAAEMLEQNPPVYLRRNLENHIACASAHGCAVLLATFYNSREFPRDPRSSSPEYVAAYAEVNALVQAIGREQGVPVFDFAASFPQDAHLTVDGRHVTEAGAALQARLFADFLIENALIP